MVDPQNEIIEFFSRSWGYIASILAGVLAKVSTEILMKRKLSFIQWIAIVGISVFFGGLSALWCDSYHVSDHARYTIPPLCTLRGEKIMIYVTSTYKRIGDAILSIFTKK